MKTSIHVSPFPRFGAVLLALGLVTPAFAQEQAGARFCALFTEAEVVGLIGKPVTAGKIAGPRGIACQWTATDGTGYLHIRAIPADYWLPPSHSGDYRALAGIGQAAYVMEEMGGWAGGVKNAREAITLELIGPAASADAAARLLKIAVDAPAARP
jgi:hypothetical protein